MADSHWIEHAKIKKGAYGHHSAAVMARDAKGSGIKAKRARLAQTFAKMRRGRTHAENTQRMYGKK